MNPLLLVLALATSTLLLRSGERLVVEGPVREHNGVVTFRMNGLLYSMPASEIAPTPALAPGGKAAEEESFPRRLRVTAEQRKRLLRELERNHSGTPAPPTQAAPPPPPPPTPGEVRQQRREEWEWRQTARAYDEDVRRALEELELLEQRIEQLQRDVRTFVSLGFKPHQFTYQTSQLVLSRESLPAARLAVTRAERARDQFREDARRQGILPGWLR